MLPASVSAFACVSTVLVPLSVIALASETPLAAACNVVPFAKVRSPVPSAVLDPIASVPALSAVPPEYKLLPDSVSVPAPILVSPPVPLMVPASVALLPLVSNVPPPLLSATVRLMVKPERNCKAPPPKARPPALPPRLLSADTASVPVLIVVPPE
jgi:hypothetical protein